MKTVFNRGYCIICGKETDGYYENEYTRYYLCESQECMREMRRLNGG